MNGGIITHSKQVYDWLFSSIVQQLLAEHYKCRWPAEVTMGAELRADMLGRLCGPETLWGLTVQVRGTRLKWSLFSRVYSENSLIIAPKKPHFSARPLF